MCHMKWCRIFLPFPEHLESLLIFGGVCVAQSLLLCWFFFVLFLIIIFLCVHPVVHHDILVCFRITDKCLRFDCCQWWVWKPFGKTILVLIMALLLLTYWKKSQIASCTLHVLSRLHFLGFGVKLTEEMKTII